MDRIRIRTKAVEEAMGEQIQRWGDGAEVELRIGSVCAPIYSNSIHDG